MILAKVKTTLQIITIVTGVFLGAYFSSISNAQHHEFDNSGLTPHSSMEHGVIDITNDSVHPEIKKLTVIKDPMSGWNLLLETENFRFTPQNASNSHIPGEGHAHLYINGKKVARLYSNWFHIPNFKEDKNEIKVTLNANSHAVFMLNNSSVSKTIYQKNGGSVCE